MKFFDLLKEVMSNQIKIGIYIMPFNLLDLILKIFLPITLALVLYKILKKTILKGILKSKMAEEKKEIVQKWTRIILRAALATLTILFVINLLGARITEYLKLFASILTHPIVQDISIATILLTIPVIYLSRLAGKVAEKFAQMSIFPYVKTNPGTKNMAETIIKNVVVGLSVLFGLTLIGFNLSLLYGLFGVIGIGIGFGLQGVVANLFAGLILLATKPVSVGHHIIVDGKEGELIEIRFVNSIISTIEHETIIIPNSKLIDNPVHNYSFDDRHIKIKNPVQVSYNSDLEKVLEVLKDVGEICPFKLKNKEILTRVSSFDDSGITVTLIIWIKKSDDKYEAMSWINLELWRAFKSNGIEIPFPQLDLHLPKKS